MSVLQETLDFPIRVMLSSFIPQGSQECIKIPPMHWSSLIEQATRAPDTAALLPCPAHVIHEVKMNHF